jgi:hypothetical protein
VSRGAALLAALLACVGWPLAGCGFDEKRLRASDGAVQDVDAADGPEDLPDDGLEDSPQDGTEDVRGDGNEDRNEDRPTDSTPDAGGADAGVADGGG